MDEKDLQIENILDDKKSKDKKKVDGKDKGDRTERNLCKLFTDHFGTDFTKAPGSGAIGTVRFGRLPEHAMKTLTGDLCVPEGFKWVIECKGGYEDKVDLNNVMDKDGIAQMDEWIEQTTRDSTTSGRKSLICWKRNRKPWIAIIKLDNLAPLTVADFPYRVHYREWVMLSLEKLLEKTEKEFWFNG